MNPCLNWQYNTVIKNERLSNTRRIFAINIVNEFVVTTVVTTNTLILNLLPWMIKYIMSESYIVGNALINSVVLSDNWEKQYLKFNYSDQFYCGCYL